MEKLVSKSLGIIFKKRFAKKTFVAGKTPIPVSGKVFDLAEIRAGVGAVLDGWWTEGRFAQEFEKKLTAYLGVRYVTLVNSGSSANLLAISALTATILGQRAIKRDDEIITAATGFPTTVNPIIQNNCVPVFVDNDLATKNVTLNSLKKAISAKTKAIILAHTLGNPLPLKEIMGFVKKNNLWFIEDCCDALGARYDHKMLGTFGDLATFSFYPAHQITMGEGGAVVTNNPLIHKTLRQFRDWGRDCWCDTGRDNTCGRRFSWQLGELPFGYDHKYIYSQIGYNLKLTDFQAAIGLAQFKKLPQFILKRQKNFNELYKFFQEFQQFFVLSKWEKYGEPCWFGFMLVVKPEAPFSRLEIVKYLESKRIATRSLFGGNLTRHPAYQKIKYRAAEQLINSDLIMNNGFWIGVYPGITKAMLEYVKKCFRKFLQPHIKP